jgi:lysophospholipase L1-like esterase
MTLLRRAFPIFAFAVLSPILFAQTPDPSAAPLAANATFTPANRALPTIFIVGDSTAAFHADQVAAGASGSQGWGVYFDRFFDLSKVNVVNAARGGRSSRTYRTEGLWSKVLAEVRPHDIVLLQLGQNDVFAINDATRARGTIPGTGDDTQEIDNMLTHQHEVVHSFGWYIRQDVKEAKAKGATVIVMSLTPRDKWANGQLERGAPDYRAWTRTIAAQEHVDFCDITEVMAREYEKLGEERTRTLYHNGESVHVNTAGAALNARWTVAGLKALPDAPINRFLSNEGSEVPPARVD